MWWWNNTYCVWKCWVLNFELEWSYFSTMMLIYVFRVYWIPSDTAQLISRDVCIIWTTLFNDMTNRMWITFELFTLAFIYISAKNTINSILCAIVRRYIRIDDMSRLPDMWHKSMIQMSFGVHPILITIWFGRYLISFTYEILLVVSSDDLVFHQPSSR